MEQNKIEYKIYDKNKTTTNISLLIPLWKVLDMTQPKKHKEENKFYYFSNILCYSQTRSNKPPLQDDNSSKTTNAESIQANNHTAITL